mgnify:FL=1
MPNKIIQQDKYPRKSIENYMEKDIKLAKAIEEAFARLYIYDRQLISSRPKKYNDTIGINHHVGERAIVFRFAYYLQQILDEHNIYADYNLDCEYNRNGSKSKEIISLDKNVYPDLIIHQRRINDNNLLVMEFKTYWNKDQNEDIKKIKAFINERDGYNYKYGIAVLIGESTVNLKMFEKDGQIFEDDKVYK